MTTGSQQRVLIPQISKQGSSLQQAPPAAAHNDVPVGAFFPQTTPTKKLSVIERKRKSCPNARQEIPVNIIFTFTNLLLTFSPDNCCHQ